MDQGWRLSQVDSQWLKKSKKKWSLFFKARKQGTRSLDLDSYRDKKAWMMIDNLNGRTDLSGTLTLASWGFFAKKKIIFGSFLYVHSTLVRYPCSMLVAVYTVFFGGLFFDGHV